MTRVDRFGLALFLLRQFTFIFTLVSLPLFAAPLLLLGRGACVMRLLSEAVVIWTRLVQVRHSRSQLQLQPVTFRLSGKCVGRRLLPIFDLLFFDLLIRQIDLLSG